MPTGREAAARQGARQFTHVTESPAAQLAVGAVRCAQYRERKQAALKKIVAELSEQPADCVLKADMSPVWMKGHIKRDSF
ncbi:hypothetical protein GRJ2_001630900 [Grus japonensis]|uniref:Uncharacterized protein n=1 Tax=Grus japonensis TaxID=30415 RepID=A0ABC9X249_GRUJA